MNLRAFDSVATCIGALLLLFVAAFWVFVLLAGCTPQSANSLPAYCTNEPLYTAALLACVDKSETLSESKSCRESVDRTCGITQTITRQR